MIFLRLILTNLSRHRIRTAISVAGIAFAVAAMLTVVTILQGAVGMFSSLLSADSQIVVFERNVADLFFSSVPQSAMDAIPTWALVEHANPVLFGIVASPTQPIITCFGVTATDTRLTRATWVAGSDAAFRAAGQAEDGSQGNSAQAANSVVLGERAAEFLHAQLHSTIALGNGHFTVGGILRTRNGFEDGGVFMPLATAQRFFHKQGIASVVTVKLRHASDAAAFKARLQREFPTLIALEDQEFNNTYSQFKILKATAWAVGLAGVLMGGLGVANTMIMSVFTRIREIAILRVNGFSPLQLTALILGEAAVVSFTGSVVGLGTGVLAVMVLKSVPMLHGYVDATMSPGLLLAVTALATGTGIAGALYPAAYAMRVRPVEALRFE